MGCPEVNFLLDTHILIWWFQGASDLPSRYKQLLVDAEQKESPIGISIISLWEIALLQSRGRVRFSISLDHWFSELEVSPWIHILPLKSSIILESTRLGETFHKDPADRMIVATARCENLKLLSVDEKICQSGLAIIA